MPNTYHCILTHGGAGSDAAFRDGAETACRMGMDALGQGTGALEAAVRGVVALENDGRFNAGVGSRARADGSVQMDACVMDSDGRFGAVAVVEGFRNPVLIAHKLMASEHCMRAGRGAAEFALEHDFETWTGRKGTADASYEGSDTVGCVAFDGTRFAAALSTGGTGGSPAGRVGDVPLLGCGLYAGPYGAVAATGKGEAIARNMTAFRAYQMLEEGMGPNFVIEEVLDWFEEDEDIGLILMSRKAWAGQSNRSMAWSGLSEGEP